MFDDYLSNWLIRLSQQGHKHQFKTLKMFKMKYLFFVVMSLIIFSCSSGNNKDTQNISLVKKYVEAVENFDYETMASLLDDNYLGIGPSSTDSIQKTQAIESWQQSSELYSKIKYNRAQYIAVTIDEGDLTGDWVSNWALVNIIYQEENRSVDLWANTVYQIENERITRSYTFYNEAEVLEQLGYVFINPNDL